MSKGLGPGPVLIKFCKSSNSLHHRVIMMRMFAYYHVWPKPMCLCRRVITYNSIMLLEFLQNTLPRLVWFAYGVRYSGPWTNNLFLFFSLFSFFVGYATISVVWHAYQVQILHVGKFFMILQSSYCSNIVCSPVQIKNSTIMIGL